MIYIELLYWIIYNLNIISNFYLMCTRQPFLYNILQIMNVE